MLLSLDMRSACQSTKWNSGVSITHIYVLVYLHYVLVLLALYSHTCPAFNLIIRIIVNAMSYCQKTLSLLYMTGIDLECMKNMRSDMHGGLTEDFSKAFRPTLGARSLLFNG